MWRIIGAELLYGVTRGRERKTAGVEFHFSFLWHLCTHTTPFLWGEDWLFTFTNATAKIRCTVHGGTASSKSLNGFETNQKMKLIVWFRHKSLTFPSHLLNRDLCSIYSTCEIYLVSLSSMELILLYWNPIDFFRVLMIACLRILSKLFFEKAQK